MAGCLRRTGWLISPLLLAAFIWPSSSSAFRSDDFGYNAVGTEIEATVLASDYGYSGYGAPGDINVMIQRDGRTFVDRLIWWAPGCRDCKLIYPGKAKVIDLGGSKEPEIMFFFFSGGAHCCFSTLIYYWTGYGYQATPHVWMHSSPHRYLRRSGFVSMVTSDQRFPYVFDCYACSTRPIRIWQFRAGSMDDVTRRHRKLIAKDLRKNSRLWHRRARHGRASSQLASWAADMCLLNKCGRAFRIARRAASRGAVSESIYNFTTQRYMRKLKRTFRRWGYLRN